MSYAEAMKKMQDEAQKKASSPAMAPAPQRAPQQQQQMASEQQRMSQQRQAPQMSQQRLTPQMSQRQLRPGGMGLASQGYGAYMARQQGMSNIPQDSPEQRRARYEAYKRRMAMR